MRMTCLKCGHQVECAAGQHAVGGACVCGQEYTNPEVFNTGTRPNERAAEQSRYQAFRAAGLVRNIGGFGLGISLLGLVFFPLGLVGAGVGIYVLTMLKGAVARYSGRRAAIAALIVGVLVFVGEGVLLLSWRGARLQQRLVEIQQTAPEDLAALARAQKLFRASRDTFGSFDEVRYTAPHGCYTIYLGLDDRMGGSCEGALAATLPPGYTPEVTVESFTAVAVANLDDDAAVDIWVATDEGTAQHVVNDLMVEE